LCWHTVSVIDVSNCVVVVGVVGVADVVVVCAEIGGDIDRAVVVIVVTDVGILCVYVVRGVVGALDVSWRCRRCCG